MMERGWYIGPIKMVEHVRLAMPLPLYILETRLVSHLGNTTVPDHHLRMCPDNPLSSLSGREEGKRYISKEIKLVHI